MTQRQLLTVGDCPVGSIVRLDLGTVRICSLSAGGERWCRMLRDDLSETTDIVWVANETPVLELLADQRQYAGGVSGEVDPLQARSR